MEENVGGMDRFSRWVIGGGLIIYGFSTKGWKRWAALTAGSNLLGTAAVKKCLINKVLDVNTSDSSRENEERIDEASMESFPASDAPSWTSGVTQEPKEGVIR